jgi:hypothetical protein
MATAIQNTDSPMKLVATPLDKLNLVGGTGRLIISSNETVHFDERCKIMIVESSPTSKSSLLPRAAMAAALSFMGVLSVVLFEAFRFEKDADIFIAISVILFAFSISSAASLVHVLSKDQRHNSTLIRVLETVRRYVANEPPRGS